MKIFVCLLPFVVNPSALPCRFLHELTGNQLVIPVGAMGAMFTPLEEKRIT